MTAISMPTISHIYNAIVIFFRLYNLSEFIKNATIGEKITIDKNKLGIA
jgi:hypothetical protein